MIARVLPLMALFLGSLPLLAKAEEKAPADTDAGVSFFEAKVRPVLVKHCYECHSAGAGMDEGGLQLDTRQATRTGGDRGPAVVPKDAEASWLLKAVSHAEADLKMPPKRERLSETVIADLRKWIEMGAPDPRTEAAAKGTWTRAGKDFWAFQTPKKSHPPAVKDAAWPRRSLDQFVLSKLEERELAPSPDASPGVLLRRLHFDLVGLPPSVDDLKRFVARIETDGPDKAIALEVDDLLASPRFGERWGRHWLDVARFAESSGTEANISFPYAWRYRDYVIDCVNDDVPFDRFLTEQIAGDLLPWETDAERARLLIATGFLAVGRKNLDAVDARQFQADLVDEQIDAVTRAFLGSSVACARCHDHKFDPFSMEDYYALAGIFESTKTFFGTAVSPANRIGGDPLRLPGVDGQKVLHPSLPKKKVEELQQQLAALRAEKAEMDEAQRAAYSGKKPKKQFTLTDALRVFWQSGGIEGQLEKVSDTGAALPLTMGVLDHDQPRNARLFERGDINTPGPEVPRGLPQTLAADGSSAMPQDRSGRLELARWLTDPQHPLTARVMANRIWHHLFGAGLVASVDNFGSTGDRPSHPELLDTLAVQFVENGWSVKHMIREIVLSRAYRQASVYRADAFVRDPENRFLWRVAKRRLEAECIRDAMLSVAGELDVSRPAGSLVGRVIGDRPISLIGLDKRLPPDLDGCRNRSVYLPVIRDRLPDVLDLFDFAESSLVTGARETTNVPIQALYLLNSPFVLERAEGLATRLVREHSSDEPRLRAAFQLCFSREPEPEELDRGLRFLNGASANEAGEAVPASLVSFCQALLCTGEFRNVD